MGYSTRRYLWSIDFTGLAHSHPDHPWFCTSTP